MPRNQFKPNILASGSILKHSSFRQVVGTVAFFGFSIYTLVSRGLATTRAVQVWRNKKKKYCFSWVGPSIRIPFILLLHSHACSWWEMNKLCKISLSRVLSGMVKITWEDKPFKERKVNFVAWNLSNHNFPNGRARELFKPSRYAESFLDSIFF